MCGDINFQDIAGNGSEQFPDNDNQNSVGAFYETPLHETYYSWKEDIKSGMDEWLDKFSVSDESNEENDLELPDLYSFYSELCSLRSENKKTSKRNYDFSTQINDSLDEMKSTLDTILKQSNKDTVITDEYKTKLFKPLTDMLVRFERISDKIQNFPKFTWFSPPQKLKSSLDSLEQGILLVKSNFNDLLSSEKISRIKTVNEVFDPYTMTAVAVEERNDISPNIIIEEIRPGFLLKDKVLVLAEVKVSKSKG